jgi:TM2 domain-containing membrane protein YozV
MLQKILLPVVIFVIILVALTFGETISHDLFAWISSLTGLVINNFADIYNAAAGYVHRHTGKVVTALVLTVPITWWALKSQGDRLGTPGKRRKVAIILAVFLGWLGGHRFYLGEIGMGILYLVILYVFTPLAVILGLIDAIRYIFMSDDDFAAAGSELTQ